MIGIAVDSNSQLPPALADRYGIRVVPLTVTVDGVDYREGVDLGADEFYDFWRDGHTPVVTTSQPSPAAFGDAYRTLIDAGATEILSVHIAASMSGTLNAARIGARDVPVAVRLVDTGTASFGIACAAWAAAEAIGDGADLESAATVAEARAAALATVFVVGVPALIDGSGRADGVDVGAAATDGTPVLAMVGGELSVIDTVSTTRAAVQTMADFARDRTPAAVSGLRVAVGTSDATSRPLGAALTSTLTHDPAVADIVQYRIGPSVGAYTGPGTAGLFVF